MIQVPVSVIFNNELFLAAVAAGIVVGALVAAKSKFNQGQALVVMTAILGFSLLCEAVLIDSTADLFTLIVDWLKAMTTGLLWGITSFIITAWLRRPRGTKLNEHR